jgi:phosphoribosylglycinamide formyltransferase-1
MTRIAVLASGRGSNFEALAAAAREGRLPAELVLLLSDSAQAGALAVAERFGIPSAVILPAKPRGRLDAASERRFLAACQDAGAEWVCLAGFMRILGATFLGAYRERVLNIHPSLLPAFPGLDAQGQAWAYGVRVSGCSVHLVDEGIDTGPLVMQRAVPVLAGDDADRLAARILAEEHRLYAAALGRLLTEPWRREGRRLVFTTETEGET